MSSDTPATPSEPKAAAPTATTVSPTIKIPARVYVIIAAIYGIFQIVMPLISPSPVVDVKTSPTSQVSVHDGKQNVTVSTSPIASSTQPTIVKPISTAVIPIAVPTATSVQIPIGWHLEPTGHIVKNEPPLDPHDPRDVKVHDVDQGARFYIPLPDDVNDLKFETDPANEVELMRNYATNALLISVVTQTPGRYVIFTAGNFSSTSSAHTYARKDVVQVGPVITVVPTPIPPKPDDVKPLPPAPVVADDVGLRVLIVEETGGADYNNTKAYHTSNDKLLTNWLDANARKNAGKPDWRRYDKDTDLTGLPKIYRDMMEAAKTSGAKLPAFAIVNGNKGAIIAVPDTVPAAIAELEKYK